MSGSLSLLRVVNIGQSFSAEQLAHIGDRVLQAFDGHINGYELREHDIPEEAAEVEALSLTTVLDIEIGGHILAVTDLDILYQDGPYDHILGGKNKENAVALVSTRRLSPNGHSQQDQEELTMERATKVALHEVGHNLGLYHHYGYRRVNGGTYCPMTKGEYNRFSEADYLRAVVDGRGFTFCGECRNVMRYTSSMMR